LITATPPDSLARRSWKLLAVEVGIGGLDLGLDLLDPRLDRLGIAGPSMIVVESLSTTTRARGRAARASCSRA
jgi:hypothetical protein